MTIPWVALILVSTFFAMTGATCPNGGPSAQQDERIQQIQRLQDELADRNRELASKDDQLVELQQQIERLNALPSDRRLAVMPRVQRMEPAPLSGGFDDNGDGVDDGIVIYLTFIDEDGDAVKAIGRVRVRLLDLSAAPERIEVGERVVGPEELRKCWYGRVASQHYAIKTPWGGGLKRPPAKSITAVVSFTEYLTGRVFEWQGAFDVSGFGRAAQATSPASELGGDAH